MSEATAELPPVFTTDEILARSEDLDSLETIVGFAKDNRKPLGYRLRKLRGRHLVDAKGRRFEFGRRDVAAGAKYPITFL